MLEAIPPLGKRGKLAFHFAAGAAQPQEIVAGAEARMLEQTKRTLARALLETRLQCPGLLDGRLEAAWNRQPLGLLLEHPVHRIEQGRHRTLTLGLGCVPGGEHLVPQQRGEHERGRGRLAVADALVGIRQRELDKTLAQRLLQNHVEQRQHTVMQTVKAQALEGFDGVTRQEELFHLVEQPRRWNVFQKRRELGDRRRGLLFDGDAELGREARAAQHAHRVLAVARDRVADQPQPPRLDVRDAADVVPHLLGGGVEVERVDGEIAAERILCLRAEDVIRQKSSVLIGCVVAGLQGAEGCHLDGLGSGQNVDQPEAAADDECPPEQRLDLLRCRVGGEIEVFGRDPEQQVAHRAADDEGFEACLLELADDVVRAARDLTSADRMRIRSVNEWFGRGPAGNQAREKAADHRAIKRMGGFVCLRDARKRRSRFLQLSLATAWQQEGGSAAAS